nr:MAG TPA: hypothetical protein [Caudoviricetes sp.]
MNIIYTSKNNTYGDIPVGECFQIPDDDEHCLYIKTPTITSFDYQINALNLNNMQKLVFLGEDDIIIPVKTELKVFTN